MAKSHQPLVQAQLQGERKVKKLFLARPLHTYFFGLASSWCCDASIGEHVCEDTSKFVAGYSQGIKMAKVRDALREMSSVQCQAKDCSLARSLKRLEERSREIA